MKFVHPWFLLFLPLAFAWAVLERRRTDRHFALVLKTCVFVSVITALAQPQLALLERRVALGMLVDFSASARPLYAKNEDDITSRARFRQGLNSTYVIPFAGSPSDMHSEVADSAVDQRLATGATNLEAAICGALARRPAERVPRLLLISDGQENSGRVERAMYQARSLGIPVDTIPLEGKILPSLQLSSVAFPSRLFTGEKFPMEVVVTSPRAAQAKLEISAEGKSIGVADVSLDEGKNTLRLNIHLDAVGPAHLSGVVSAIGLGEVRFDRVATLSRPRLLLLSREGSESTRPLHKVLEAADFKVAEEHRADPEELSKYQVVLAVNADIESWPSGLKRSVEEAVRGGRGFALIAGENNTYAEHDGDDDPMQKMLPATLMPPRTPDGNTVVLIMDKSSSMSGNKIELARSSAIGVVENLRTFDQVGVLVLDNSFEWAVRIRKADDTTSIRRLIEGIVADGGTNIAPALREAYRQIRGVDAIYKHIVLLTDGISEAGDSYSTARMAGENRVTISTIGLGTDVNRQYLEQIASLSKGKAYFLNDFSKLEQLVLQDVEQHTGSTMVERKVHVDVLRQVEMLEGTHMEQAPPLLGYLRFEPKPDAEVILRVDGKYPLLTRWQYGLGRSAVFASDARNRWADGWLEWPGYSRFWANLARDLLPRASTTEVRTTFDSTNKEIILHYFLQPGAETGNPAELYVIGPNGFQKAVRPERLTESRYMARVPIGDEHGLFHIRPDSEGSMLPEVGYYREQEELAQRGTNLPLLRQIALSTGGRYNPAPEDMFDAGDRAIPMTLALWPMLLALAVIVNMAELAERKGYLRLSRLKKH